MSRQKAKGTLGENRVRDYLRAVTGLDVRRNPPAGTRDVGDLSGVTFAGEPAVVEVKKCSAPQVARWMREARVEARHAQARLWCVVWDRPRHMIADADVYVPLAQLCVLCGTSVASRDMADEVGRVDLRTFAQLVDRLA